MELLKRISQPNDIKQFEEDDGEPLQMRFEHSC